MKLRVVSDIHWEFDNKKFQQTKSYNTNGSLADFFWTPSKLEDDINTTLIIAGDMWYGNKSIDIIETFNKQFKSIILIFGNHDHWYSSSIQTNIISYNKELINRGLVNVHLLDGDIIKIDEYIIIGATLWTDMNNSNPITVQDSKMVMSHDFNYIKEFSPDLWLMENAKDFLMIHENVKSGKNIIVISHHGPCEQSVAQKYKGSPDNYYFYSDYSDYILDNPNIRGWIHGHCHNYSNYLLGSTRIIANPRGYPNENQGFHDTLVIEL